MSEEWFEGLRPSFCPGCGKKTVVIVTTYGVFRVHEVTRLRACTPERLEIGRHYNSTTP